MARFEFDRSDDWYTVEGAKSMDSSILRKEYTRLRDIAQKRIERLGKDYSWTKQYNEHRKGFDKIKDIDPRDLPKAFSELAKFVRAKGSSASGQKEIQKKTMRTLNEAIGESGAVNARNYRRVVSLLNEARKQKIVYGSDKIVQLADATLELNQDSFDSVLDNLESLITHSDEVEDALSAYSAENELSDYSQVDMGDLIQKIGW